jgi:hypothetical protein
VEEIDESNPIPESVEPWSLPPPPEINFLVPPRNAWNSIIPQTIKDQSSTSTSSRNNNKSHTRSINSNKLQKGKNETDTHTNYKSATYTSETMDVISDLQDESRQHSQLIDDHNNRIIILEQQQQQLYLLQSMNDQILQIETRLTQVIEQNNNMNSSLNDITGNLLPAITSTLTGHHDRMIQINIPVSTMQQNFNTSTQSVEDRITIQQNDITNIYSIINSLQNNNFNNQTQTDSRRRKKSKQRIIPTSLCEEPSKNDSTTNTIIPDLTNNMPTNAQIPISNSYNNTAEEDNEIINSSPYSITDSTDMLDATPNNLFN